MDNLIAVDKGALQMAINVLKRGSDIQKEIGDALKSSADCEHITSLEERVKELEASRKKIASSLVDKIFQDLEPETQKAILNYRLAEVNKKEGE